MGYSKLTRTLFFLEESVDLSFGVFKVLISIGGLHPLWGILRWNSVLEAAKMHSIACECIFYAVAMLATGNVLLNCTSAVVTLTHCHLRSVVQILTFPVLGFYTIHICIYIIIYSNYIYAI